jgi:hypothetical protein
MYGSNLTSTTNRRDPHAHKQNVDADDKLNLRHDNIEESLGRAGRQDQDIGHTEAMYRDDMALGEAQILQRDGLASIVL